MLSLRDLLVQRAAVPPRLGVRARPRSRRPRAGHDASHRARRPRVSPAGLGRPVTRLAAAENGSAARPCRAPDESACQGGPRVVPRNRLLDRRRVIRLGEQSRGVRIDIGSRCLPPRCRPIVPSVHWYHRSCGSWQQRVGGVRAPDMPPGGVCQDATPYPRMGEDTPTQGVIARWRRCRTRTAPAASPERPRPARQDPSPALRQSAPQDRP